LLFNHVKSGDFSLIKLVEDVSTLFFVSLDLILEGKLLKIKSRNFNSKIKEEEEEEEEEPLVLIGSNLKINHGYKYE